MLVIFFHIAYKPVWKGRNEKWDGPIFNFPYFIIFGLELVVRYLCNFVTRYEFQNLSKNYYNCQLNVPNLGYNFYKPNH